MPEDPYYQIKRKFHQTFYKTIYPYLLKLENKRIKIRNNYIITGLIIAIIIAVFINETKNSPIAIFISVFCFLIFIGVYSELQKKFEFETKRAIMPQICECFEDLTWGISTKYIDESLLFFSYIARYDSVTNLGDIFNGSYKGINFQITEAQFKWHQTGSSKDASWGTIINIEMNKNFTSHTMILPNTSSHGALSYVLERTESSNFVFRAELEYTELEDVVFEKKYDVYTNDKIEARYLITTSFMERLNNIEKIFKTTDMLCAFYEGRLLIGLPCKKDMFCAAKLNKTLKDTTGISTMFDEIISIYKLIDYLKLEQKIGL